MPGCGPRLRSDIVDLGLSGCTFGSRLVMLHFFMRTEELANLMVEGLGFQAAPVEAPKDEMQASNASMHGTDLMASRIEDRGCLSWILL